MLSDELAISQEDLSDIMAKKSLVLLEVTNSFLFWRLKKEYGFRKHNSKSIRGAQ